MNHAYLLAGKPALSSEDSVAVDALRIVCEAQSGLDLKLEVGEVDGAGRQIHFLARAGDDLVGYGGITGGKDAEACGMVHPTWRQRGIGTAVLEAVLGAAGAVGRSNVLVICEDAATVALEWMRRRGANLASSEQRMVARIGPAEGRPGAQLKVAHGIALQPATPADRPAIVALLADAFSESASQLEERLTTQSTEVEETLVARQAGEVVGVLRLTRTSRRPMIYGFVVSPARRGRGVGRAMLSSTIDVLQQRGVTEVGLEVDPDNVPAVRLYENHGFHTVTTYRYMRLSVPSASR